MRGADHRPGSSPVQPPAERSPRPPSGVRGGSPPKQRVCDQGRQHEQPDHEKHAHPFILTRSPKLTHFAPFRAGRKSGPHAHTAGTSARTSSRRASRTRRPTRSPDPISSYWRRRRPPCRRVPTRSRRPSPGSATATRRRPLSPPLLATWPAPSARHSGRPSKVPSQPAVGLSRRKSTAAYRRDSAQE